MKANEDKGGCLIMAGLLGFVILLVASCDIAYQRGTVDTVTVRVKKLERVGGDNGKYLIYTEEGEVFQNSDALFHWKFDSSDLYGGLNEGQSYEFKVYGWRVRPLSVYRNVIDAIPQD